MDVISIYRHARISPYKAREVTREIQGLPVSQALDIVAFTPKKAAFLVGKTLKSAIANAENNHDLMADTLVVKECVVGDGPRFRRFKARARGSAAPIKRRTSHIRIILTDETGEGVPKAKKPAPKKAAAAAKPAPAKTEAAAPKAEKKQVAAPAPEAASDSAGANLGLVYDKAPDNVDDLKRISGVGPALEEKLHNFGIYTYEQVAAWEAEQVSAFDDLLSFKGRIERDEWIRQANELITERDA